MPSLAQQALAFDGILHHLQDQLQANLVQQQQQQLQRGSLVGPRPHSWLLLENDQKQIMLQVQWTQQQLALVTASVLSIVVYLWSW